MERKQSNNYSGRCRLMPVISFYTVQDYMPIVLSIGIANHMVLDGLVLL